MTMLAIREKSPAEPAHGLSAPMMSRLCCYSRGYRQSGRIDLQVGTSGPNVFVRVTDNGIGIPEKDLPRLFDRFYRVDKARSRESGGTGLGLSIAQEILNQHKGRIEISSEYGKGTSVLITMPAAEAQA